jgi:pyruvate dehydrogenase (quinone)/pyruvate oxidase
MGKTTADLLVEKLIDWDINVVFGIPGDGINGIIEALRKQQEKVRFIQVRHEEAAAFMACAYAKYTKKLGVCLATSGPGGIHLLNGLYDAKLDQQSVLALTGLQYHDLIGTYSQQDVELDKLFEDVSVYNGRVMCPQHLVNVTALACRSALAYHGVAHVTIPVDIQTEEVEEEEPSKRNVPHHTSDVQTPHPVPLRPADLGKAADILNSSKKIVILAGQGALDATDELEKVAEVLQAPIVKALLGRASVPDDSPYTTGPVGLVGTKPSQEALEECDALLIVGSSFPYIEFYPKPGTARGIQVEHDPKRVGLRYPVEVGLVGDSKATLQQLLPLLKKNGHDAFLKKAQKGMEEWRQLMESRGTRGDKPMKPQVVAWELGKRLSNDAIVSCDSGTITTWWARQIPVKRGQMHSVSGNLATMACGLPYAIAAQIAYPGRQSIAFVGDGGFSMLMAEFVTCVKYNLPVKIFIIKNNSLGQIKWEQMVFLGNPEYGCELQPIDFAAFARACGGSGFTIDDPARCGEVIEEALTIPGPVVVEAMVDPHEPPLPATVTMDQALKFAESLARGTPYRGKIAMTVLRDKVRELL